MKLSSKKILKKDDPYPDLVGKYWLDKIRSLGRLRGLRRTFIKLINQYPRYFGNLADFIKQEKSLGFYQTLELYPILGEWTAKTSFDSHYVYQGPWLFEKLLQIKPKSHVDVASYVGYLGFMSAIVPTTFVDIRPTGAKFKGFTEKVGSILKLPYKTGEVESLSCLHVIEHVGLGRYGDPIDVEGTREAAKELKRVLAPGGNLYVSLPVGKPKVYFNAHRVLDPGEVLKYFSGLDLVELSGIDDRGNLINNVSLSTLRNSDYACGLFWFRKSAK